MVMELIRATSPMGGFYISGRVIRPIPFRR